MVKLVGILNITPDSFSDGGLYTDTLEAENQFKELLNEGASFVDIGAESTRPGAEKLDSDTEWKRLKPLLNILLPKYGKFISIDTYHPETAKRALEMGVSIINDVTGLKNNSMVQLIRMYKATCILCHLVANDTQSAHEGELLDDITVVTKSLLTKYDELVNASIDPQKIILDPGIGFGKTPELNRKLLEFSRCVPGYKVMVGYSRKRFLGAHRMELKPNLEAGLIATKAGASYLRVHDVTGHKKLLGHIY